VKNDYYLLIIFSPSNFVRAASFLSNAIVCDRYEYCQIIYSYLFTPRYRVLLEKLTGLQLVKKFPAFYGSRRFITAFTSFRHPSLSWASPIQSTCPQSTSWRSIL